MTATQSHSVDVFQQYTHLYKIRTGRGGPGSAGVGALRRRNVGMEGHRWIGSGGSRSTFCVHLKVYSRPH